MNNDSINPMKEVMQFILKHFKMLSVVFLSTAIISYLALRFLVTPLYLSTTVIYPVNIKTLSSEDETEQLVQVLQSADIQGQIVDSFNLIEHYKLGNKKSLYHNLNRIYNKRVNVERTPYSSIEISVLDRNKNKAASMANAIVELMNKKINEMKREKFAEWAKFYEGRVKSKTASLKQLENELAQIKTEKGIVNYEEQSGLVASKLGSMEEKIEKAKVKIETYKAIHTRAAQDSVKINNIKLNIALIRKTQLDTQFANLLAVGDKINGLEQKLELEREVLSEYQSEYEFAKDNVSRNIGYAHVITKAGPADRHHYPKRMFSAFLIAFSTIMLLCIVIAIKNQAKEIVQ